MHKNLRALLIGGASCALLVSWVPSASAAGTISCAPVTVTTLMDTPVSGTVSCTNSSGAAVHYALRPYAASVAGPYNGKIAFDGASGNFTYTPGFYPPAAPGGVQEELPEWTGFDEFTVAVSSDDGASASVTVNVNVDGPAVNCDPNFVAETRTMFNDPSGSSAEQYRMVHYLVDMINCTPAHNDDGTQAQIKFSFYSLTYAPVQNALVQAAKRGVSVQALTNSHSDKYVAWQSLARTLGTDTNAGNFASTCWQGCLSPRTAPQPGGPTAWYSASTPSLTSLTTKFSDRSFAGSSGAPIVSWKWTFGDGKGAKGQGPHTHKYKKPGVYKTTLTVTDANGVTHRSTNDAAVPDDLEPMYPSLHSKIYLFSQVGTGANARPWVAAYSSGNPTYQQSRKGFNNLNIAVGDKQLYDIFANYFGDMTTASRGQLLLRNYFRTFQSAGNPATAAPPTTVHFEPQTVGDINRDIISDIKCKYQTPDGQWHRTKVTISVFVFTRRGVGRDVWRLAFEHGCDVDITYTQMNQRVKDKKGKWLANEDGEEMGYGVADCLATPPTRKVNGQTVANTLGGPTAKNPKRGYCHGGTLHGKVPVSRSGVWLDRTSSVTGGRLKVQMACPVAPYYDPMKKLWSVICVRNDIFTHHKVMLVDGMIHGQVQKYVMTGSANWSSPALRSSDEVVTEIQGAPALYDQYMTNFDYLKDVVRRNTSNAPGSGNKPKDGKKVKKTDLSAFTLNIPDGATVDVRGMTDAQLAGQD